MPQVVRLHHHIVQMKVLPFVVASRVVVRYPGHSVAEAVHIVRDGRVQLVALLEFVRPAVAGSDYILGEAVEAFEHDVPVACSLPAPDGLVDKPVHCGETVLTLAEIQLLSVQLSPIDCR